MEAKLKELKDAISGGLTQAIKNGMAALNQEVMQLGQFLYNQPGQPGAGHASGSPGKATDGEVITDTK